MEKFSLIIFGITGNLAQIKLIPALYDLAKNDLLPKDFSIIGVARSDKTQEEFEKYFHKVLHLDNRHHKHEINEKIFDNLCSRIEYISGDFKDSALYEKLSEKLENRNKMFYLATYPDLYKNIFESLKKSGLSNQDGSWTRIVIEKPLGVDLDSAKSLNSLLAKYFTEDQVFRLDHYLGKETMQNIINFRFGNDIFEPVVNAEYIDNIQITAAEDFGIGKRGGYYDSVGALKDVGQNHLLQMLALTTMDAPENYDNKSITRERMRIIQSIKPLPEHIVYGQYEEYKQEENVDNDSQTDTYFAFKTFIQNERFKDVPIYIRGGKRLSRTVTEVSFIFKKPINSLFSEIKCGEETNILTYRIQPNEGIVIKILAKTPGHVQEMTPSYMQFCYKQLPGDPADPYEKLINDALHGEHIFFNDADEVEAQWKFVDPLCEARKQPIIYSQGSWGPKEADELLAKDGREWIEPSIEFCQR